MQMISASCPACGGSYDGRLTSKFVTCEYCGTRYALNKQDLEALGFVDADGDGFDDSDGAPAVIDEADDNFDPMPTYACDACKKFSRRLDESYFRSSGKIVRGLEIPDGDDAYLIHDDTMFKSGKNGFAITSAGLYCREMGDRRSHFVSWKEFAAGEAPYLDGSYIRQEGVSVCYFSDNDDVLESGLLVLFQRLYHHAKRVIMV